MIPIKDPILLMTMDTSGLYALIEWILQEDPQLEKEYKNDLQIIRTGKNLKYHILYFIKTNMIEEKPEYDIVKIKGKAKAEPIEKFWEEQRLRDNIMRKIILENTMSTKPTKARRLGE